MIDQYVGVVLNEDYEIVYKWHNVRDNDNGIIIYEYHVNFKIVSIERKV